jgi:hypothetical protein
VVALADAMGASSVILLTDASTHTEMVRAEVELARSVAFDGRLPHPLDAYLNPIQYVEWQSKENTSGLFGNSGRQPGARSCTRVNCHSRQPLHRRSRSNRLHPKVRKQVSRLVHTLGDELPVQAVG